MRIAIIGMACRFPGAGSPAEFWQMLKDGVDATTEVPPERWSLDRFYNPDHEAAGKTYVRRGGFLRQKIDQFDVSLFGISPREAALLDPQQRLLMEVAWESLEEAGIVPGALRGSKTGVYVGGFTMDNQIHLLNVLNRETITTHTATGSTMGMLSNRLSYTFDLRGPSLTVDTACSSSLVALHLASQGLMQGECELALVGGVNIMLRPEYTVAMCKGGFLSPDGLCKAFDASGDGYGRGEGAGVIVLKPLQAALRDGDRIHAVVAGTGVNQDGHTDGITVPNSAAQKALMHEVRAAAGVAPDEVQYVEAHGTGTRAGDTAEAASIGEGLATLRSGDGPLLMGSVKTNVGHLEAAAGMAGVIKTVLALEHRLIPPNLHFHNPRPEINFAGLRLRIPTSLEAWPAHAGPAGAAINSFGYGGTNAHAILLEAPRREEKKAAATRRPKVFPISAAGEAALAARIRQFATLLETDSELDLADLGYMATRARTHHTHRLAVVTTSAADLAEKLHQFADGKVAAPLCVAGPRATRGDGARLAFVYTGMGPQYYGMGAELLEEEPAARELLRRCEGVWRPLAGWSLAELFARRAAEPMAEPRYAQPANFVLQLMLTEVARSYGLSPDGVVGHSVGEIAAACVGGSLSLEDALKLTYHRSQLQQCTFGGGEMLAVGLSPDEVLPYMKDVGSRATIAAVNGPTSVTLAGNQEAIIRLHEVLTIAQIFSRLLRVNVAYHSHLMDPLEAEFGARVSHIVPGTPEIPLYSTVTGSAVTGRQQDAGYWWRNARQTVRFTDAMTAMIDDGFEHFVEVGPHPVLAAAIDSCLRRAGRDGGSFALQRRDQPGLETLLGTIAQLYTHGSALDWSKQYPRGGHVSLPAYPWSRETLWAETEASRADRLGAKEHPLLASKPGEPQAAWEGELSSHVQRYLPDHRVQGEAILPASAFIEMGLVARRAKGSPVAIESFSIHQSLDVAQTPVVRLHLDSDGAGFNIYSRAREHDASWSLNASGRLLRAAAPARDEPLDRERALGRCTTRLDIEAFYRTFDEVGLQYGPGFRCLREAWMGEDEVFARLEVTPAYAHEVADYYLHPTLLDAALQTLLTLRTEDAAARRIIYLPVEVAQIRFQHKAGGAAWCRAALTRRDADEIEGDLVLYDDDGRVSAELIGLRARAVGLSVDARSWKDGLLYSTGWHAQRAKGGEEFLRQRWLVFCDEGHIGEQLVRDARARRVSCVMARRGAGFKKLADDHFEVARESREDIARLLEAVGAQGLDAVVYLWGLDIPESGQVVDARAATGTVDTIDLLHVMQELALARGPEGLTLCLATVRAQLSSDERDLSSPGQHALLGFGRVVETERPQMRLKMIDLNSRQPLSASTALLGELLSGSDESEVAFRRGIRYVSRLERWGGPRQRTALSTPETSYVLKTGALGAGGEVEFHETVRSTPGRGEVEVAVELCALDLQQDARTTGGQSPAARKGGRAALGVQVAGAVTVVGEGVTGLNAGEEVLVLAEGAELRSHVTAPQEFVVKRVAGLSATAGVALLDWAAAFYALFTVGALERGESLLVHRAESGIGQAAIRLAQWKGAQVFATAETAAKQDAIRKLGVERVTDARSLRFVDDVLSWTGGRGVDVVLSLTSGEIREKSLGVTAPDGRFLDIITRTKQERGAIPVAAFDRGLKYTALDLTRLQREKSGELRRIIDLLPSLFGPGGFDHIHAEAFPVTQAGQALQLLSRDEQVGKIVTDLRGQRVPLSSRLPVRVINPEAGYLLTGGFGGLGLETLRWLAENGCRHVAVLSRSGPASGEASALLSRLLSDGVRILTPKLDIADADALTEVMREVRDKLPPLKGVIHSAGLVDDDSIDSLGSSRVERVMNPKAVGAWHLHRALADDDLDFFVCYSSISATLGNAGQANYAAANAFLDGLVQYRRARGLAGTSINWGVISDVGMVARDERTEAHLRQLGLRGITSQQALELLEEALLNDWGHFGAFDVDWQRWRRFAGRQAEGRLSAVTSACADEDDAAAAFRRRVIKALPADRFEVVYTEVAEEVCRVLRIPGSRIDAESNLTQLGIDSLMATELAAGITARTGFSFRALLIVRGPTIAELSRRILADVLSAA